MNIVAKARRQKIPTKLKPSSKGPEEKDEGSRKGKRDPQFIVRTFWQALV